MERYLRNLRQIRKEPKKFAILAEGPLEDMRRLQDGIERLTANIATAPATA